MPYPKLTNEAQDMAALQWGDFMRRGGEGGDSLTREMYDALNHPDIRDAFLFWQVGGTPATLLEEAPFRKDELMRLHALMGQPPTKAQATDALAIALNRLPRADALIDSGTVIVLATLLWDLLDARYSEAQLVMSELIDLNLAATTGRPTHYDPMRAFGEACKVLPGVEPTRAHATLLRIFGIPEYSVMDHRAE